MRINLTCLSIRKAQGPNIPSCHHAEPIILVPGDQSEGTRQILEIVYRVGIGIAGGENISQLSRSDSHHKESSNGMNGVYYILMSRCELVPGKEDM